MDDPCIWGPDAIPGGENFTGSWVSFKEPQPLTSQLGGLCKPLNAQFPSVSGVCELASRGSLSVESPV